MATTGNAGVQARAIQRTTRQSPYKMRLVIDQIRGRRVNDALEKVLGSAVANAEESARRSNTSVDVDALVVTHAVVNEGPKLKRWTPAAMGRATPMLKRTSHVEIVVTEATR